jgi:CheY-like chemotaxis protein
MSIKQVLVVDDSKAARLVLRKMLQSINLAVDLAASGEEALKYLSARRPDAIFMDHTMPGMDGLQVIKILKNDAETAKIPVAMYTSKEEQGYVNQVKASGAIGILPKPASADALSYIINQLSEAADAVNAQSAAIYAEHVDAMIPANPATISIEAVETTAKAAAESLFNDLIHTRILPLLDEKLDNFEQSFFIDQESTILGIAGGVCNTRINGFSEKFNRQVNEQIKELKESVKSIQLSNGATPKLAEQVKTAMGEFVESKVRQIAENAMQQRVVDVAQQAAKAVYEERVGEFASRLAQQLNKQHAITKTANPRVTKSEQQVSQVMHERVETIAANKAKQSAQEAAEKTASDIVNRMIADINRNTKSVINRMYFFAISTVIFAGATVGTVIFYIK